MNYNDKEAISDRLQIGNVYEGVCGDNGVYYMVKTINASYKPTVALLKADNYNLNDPIQPYANHYVLTIVGNKRTKDIRDISFSYDDTKVEEVWVDACTLTDEMMRYHASSVYNPMLQYKRGMDKYQYDNECGSYDKDIGFNIGYCYKLTVDGKEHNIIIIRIAKARSIVIISGLVVYDDGFTESIAYSVNIPKHLTLNGIKGGVSVYCEIDTIKECARLPYQKFNYIKNCFDNGINLRVDKDITAIYQ